MTLKDVQDRVARIDATADDNEIAHVMEDDLHTDVLRAIADGTC